jgi:hypothetical protein
MSFDLHTIRAGAGSILSRLDALGMILLPQQAYPAGNGDPSAIAAGTPGAGYATIPTVAFANAGSGSGATATALMGVVANPTIAAAGSGGTNGAVTLTGTTGTGTKFQITGTIAGNVLTAITGITVAGSYSAMPSSLAAEPVTGGGLTGCTVNLSAAMGVVGYTVSSGSSNHQYAKSTTATLSGGTPTIPAVPGAVTVNTVAGQGSTIVVSGISLPAKYGIFPGDIGQAGDVYITNRTQTGFTINVAPGSSSQSLAAGAVDLVIFY